MRWVWDDEKNRKNRRDHRLSFELAQQVFHDPLALSRPDPHPDGDRWRTIGLIGSVTVFVVHTYPEPDKHGEEAGRIISARKATAHERNAYEKG